MDDDLFISEVPVERAVTLAGKQRKLWFREVSDADWYRYVSARSSDDVDTQAGARAFLISKSLCEPDGTLALTLERAASLKLRAAKEMERVIMELDSRAKDEAGNASEPGADVSGSGTL